MCFELAHFGNSQFVVAHFRNSWIELAHFGVSWFVLAHLRNSWFEAGLFKKKTFEKTSFFGMFSTSMNQFLASNSSSIGWHVYSAKKLVKNAHSCILLPHIWSHHRLLCSITKLKEHSREICYHIDKLILIFDVWKKGPSCPNWGRGVR